jgi:hypothetical protein
VPKSKSKREERGERERERERHTHTHTKEATLHISNKKTHKKSGFFVGRPEPSLS